MRRFAIRPAVAVVLVALTGTTAFAARLAEHRVGQKGKNFSVAAITVKAGDKIVFRNDDAVPHNIYSASATAKFNVRVQQPGEEAFVTLDKPGAVDVRCAFHPTMKMAVTVEP